jgi:cell wall-associated NlpC family hydrolase
MRVSVPFPSRRLCTLLIGLLLISAFAQAQAQVRVIPHRYVRRTHVTLQPFSLETPRRTHVIRRSAELAYYAPRPLPRGPRAISGDDDERDADEPATSSAPAAISSGSRPTVNGNRAVLRNGVAYAPSNAPERVKSAIWAVNSIRRKPYVWGGGHGSFNDRGYDCSGTVSYALHNAGLLSSPLPSSDLMRFGQSGRGRWITVYARHGHTFAGLRLDTTDFRYGGDVGPRWHTDQRDTRGFVANHPAGL